MRVSTVVRRRDLIAGLESRRDEISQETFSRVRAIGGGDRVSDPIYVEGLRMAVEAAIDHTIEASVRHAHTPLEVPEKVLVQARLAARKGVPLETVLRRYIAGHTIVSDFLLAEAGRLRLTQTEIQHVLRSSAAETDRTIAAISSAYASHSDRFEGGSEDRRRAEWVRRLLDGELVDQEEFGYAFDNFHIALVGRMSDEGDAIASLGKQVDAIPLVSHGQDGLLWAWLARRARLDTDRIAGALTEIIGPGAEIGLGECAQGRSGWRLSHEQARAALSVADRTTSRVVRYAEVAMLASAVNDELLATSLRALYLDPLEDIRGDAETLRKTLRAYFAAGRSASSAASALGVTRNTVTNRIRLTEERVGHLRPSRAAHLELALSLYEPEPADHRR
jgi:PucR C-terminal helix-turn-helix domain/GGDEF-like domain